jgi:hypothetical protein
MVVLNGKKTRIFGIGMHKTATSSLAAALTILGYKTAHWESPQWAQEIWRDVSTTGRSRLLERYHAVCDLPIPMLYHRLDISYPGSKFILTTRGEDAWVKSAENHWKRSSDGWDTDGFSHAMHRAVYGQLDFTEEVFRRRFRQHNEEVLLYFAKRPGDLLVMDMDQKAGWSDLCAFLGKPVPEVPYPREYVTPSNAKQT